MPLTAEFAEKIPGKAGNVFGPVAKRGDRYREDADAVIKVLAESSGFGFFEKVFIRGADKTEIAFS